VSKTGILGRDSSYLKAQ